MLNNITLRAVSAAAVLMLGACSWMQQPAAPVVVGNEGASVSTDSGSAAPYSPNTSTEQSQVPVQAAPAPTAPVVTTGGYVPSYAPVDIRAATHTVVRGDTVYNISKRYQISQDDLRTWNNIVDNNIHVGQVLRVKPAGYVAPAMVQTATTTQPPVTATTPAVHTAPTATPVATVSGGTRTVSSIVWQRPTAGQIITQYGGNSKGIDIAGTAGQAVVSAADGKVVYAGSGLRGYGNLVIVQHTPTFLTAYGHNQDLLVKEGQSVKRGQTIARMGSSDADRTKLHFEVRQNGKPVNPTTYIPQQ